MKKIMKQFSSGLLVFLLVLCGFALTPRAATPTPIHDIQGITHTSPLLGDSVTASGIVTSLDVNKGLQGFYIQAKTIDEDNDPRTSEAMYVKLATPIASGWTIKEGNEVEVAGTVAELPSTTYSGSAALEPTLTGLQSATITSQDTTDHLNEITTQIIGDGGLKIPGSAVTTTAMDAPLEITDSAMDFFESLEGMRVQVNQPQLVAIPKYDTYQVNVQADNNRLMSQNGGIIASDNAPHYDIVSLQVPYRFSNQYSSTDKERMKGQTGDIINGELTGVMTYNYTQYKIYLDYDLFDTTTNTFKANVATLTEKGNAQAVTNLTGDGETLTVAAFNVENYSANVKYTTNEKSEQVAADIVNNLGAPDIVSLEEIQDNDGQLVGTKSATADLSIERLLNDITTAGGPAYQALNIDPEYNQDGGQTNGNIRVVILYNPARVEPIDLQTADYTTTASVQAINDEALLVQNPARIGVGSPNFISTRKSLVGQFRFNEQVVTIIGNHLSSKGGDQGIFGINQPPVLSSADKRIEQAREVNQFVDSLLQVDENAHVVVLGDMNDYEYTPALQTLSGSILANKTNDLPIETRYSYSYLGRQQTLDHILVNAKHQDQTQIDAVHMNADFREENGQVSDHDPMIIAMQVTALADVESSDNNSSTNNLVETAQNSETNTNTPLPTTGQNLVVPGIFGLVIASAGVITYMRMKK